jgi:hypothetical protein
MRLSLRLRLDAIAFDGMFLKLTFRQADGHLPSIGEETISIQVPSSDLEYWIEQRRKPETIVTLTVTL